MSRREVLVDFDRPQSPPSKGRAGSGPSGAKRAGLVAVRLLLDALLIDAAVETWASGAPFRVWVVAAVAIYLALALWALVQGSRLAAPGLVTQTPAPLYLFLTLLGAATMEKAGFTASVVMLKQPTAVVLTGATLLVTWLAVFRVGLRRGAWIWFRILIVALGIYATGALVFGMLRGTSYLDLFHGRSVWERMPYWGQGAVVGGLVLIPMGFVRELAESMARVILTGYLRWMIVFGLGAWIAINAISI